MVIKSQLGLPSTKSQLGVSGGGVENEGGWRERRGGMQRELRKVGTMSERCTLPSLPPQSHEL